MTTKQMQCLLFYLSIEKSQPEYDPGGIDGIEGKNTLAALEAFKSDYGVGAEGLVGAVAGTLAKIEKPKQEGAVEAERYLQEDGCYHIPRGVDVQLSRNLRAREVHCQGKGCCQESVVNKKMVELFQEIRDDYADCIAIGTAGGSGFRCPIHNVEVNGAGNSLHLTGAAFDMHCKDKEKLLTLVQRHLKDGEYGVYPWGIHVGVWSKGCVSRFR